MLNRLCIKERIGLVNVVRRPAQAALLREQGAAFVCDQSLPSFMEDLTQALAATGATIAFDAVGGGKLAGQILGCMEAALTRSSTGYSRYGSTTHKQVYLYGSLDPSPIEFSRNFGMSWGMGGWLVFNRLERIGPQGAARLKQRVVDELHTTFASHYAGEISLAAMLSPDEVKRYAQRATGTKLLLNPNREL
jgi:NADPH2:quinone reductase